MSVVIGIIGLPCSGKSTIAEVLTRHGAITIDADAIAKSQLTDPLLIAQLVSLWGPSILDATAQPQPQLSRAAIANLVFAPNEPSRQRLRTLESIIHPRTRVEITRQLFDAADRYIPIIVLDVPLLLEVGWDRVCDEVWCVDIDPTLHTKLLAARGWTIDELNRRTANQIPIETKRRRANRILTTIEDRSGLKQTIVDIVQSWPNGPGPKHCLRTSSER